MEHKMIEAALIVLAICFATYILLKSGKDIEPDDEWVDWDDYYE